MILAAGRGERMRPLTDELPKPLLKVAGKPLIEHHLIKLQKIGVTDVVINLAWLGEKIEDYLQDGRRFGLTIHYSWESGGALETAGGIIKALPLLMEGESDVDQPFLVINGDIFIDYDFTHLPILAAETLAHLWLVDNPPHHLAGDFALQGQQLVSKETSISQTSYTFSGIGLYRRSFFSEFLSKKVVALAPLIRAAMSKGAVSGTKLTGLWTDVGTPARFQQINQQLAMQARTTS